MGVASVRVGLTERGPASGLMVLSTSVVVLLGLHRVVMRQAVAHLREEEGQAQDQDDQGAGGPWPEKPMHEWNIAAWTRAGKSALAWGNRDPLHAPITFPRWVWRPRPARHRSRGPARCAPW